MKNEYRVRTRGRGWAVWISLALLAGCGPEEEGGTNNGAGTDDVGVELDAGGDASIDPEDAGDEDTGGDEVDAGGEDAGEADAGDDAAEVVLCAEDERVDANACEACPAGTTNEAGDDASGEDTECDATLCAENERVVGNACEACAAGTTRAAGDDASGADTQCEATLCAENEYVSENACVACGAGSTNMAGDDASGADTRCDGELCASNERVVNNACEPCPAGSINAAGDDASGEDTVCDALLCLRDFYVLNNTCTACPMFTENDPGDDATGADTACDVLFCSEDQYVSSGACLDCPPGTSNPAGDDVNGNDTVCSVVFCAEDEYVSANVCTACGPGTERAAGDDATGADTVCDATLCAEDEYVLGNVCTACPVGSTNDAGDDASGADTMCDDPCFADFGVFCVDLTPTYIKSSNPGVDDEHGLNIALDGDTLVVGAHLEDSDATGVDGDGTNDDASGSGAAYVYVRDPATNTWSQQAYLKASNTGVTDNFGFDVAIDGDTIVVGARYEDSDATGVDGDGSNDDASLAGAAYVFERDPATGVWAQSAYLKAANADAGDLFGFSVAISRGTIVVGANRERSNSAGVNGDDTIDSLYRAGAAYVFTQDTNGVWSQQAYLKSSNPGYNDQFGWDVAIDGDTIAVSARYDDSNATGIDGDASNNSRSNSGAVFVFTRDASNVWTQQAYIKASNPSSGDQFGIGLALDGDTLVCGTQTEDSAANTIDGDGSDNSASNAGAAYVFVRDSAGAWSQQAYLKAANSGEGDNFGRNVRIDGDTIVVAAYREDGGAVTVNGADDDAVTDAGAAYVFTRDANGVWTQTAYLKAQNTGAEDRFGHDIAISGGLVVVGAYNEDGGTSGVGGDTSDDGIEDSGAVYVYDLSP